MELRSKDTVRRGPLAALLLASIVSWIGNSFTAIAIPWFVLQTTGSAALTGVAAAFGVLPAIVTGFFGGTLVDRLGYKRSSVLADLMSAATVGAIPLLHAFDLLGFPVLLTLVLLGAALDVPGYTARGALVPDLAAMARMNLDRANSYMQTIANLSTLIGPPLAGVMIALLGTSQVLWLDAASFVFSAVLVGCAVPGAPVRRIAGATASGGAMASSYLSEMREGLRFVLRDRLVRTMLTMFAAVNVMGAALVAVVLPVYARESFGQAVGLGLMLSGFGGGSLVGALLYGALAGRLPRRPTFLLAFAGLGLPFFALAAEPGLWVSVGLLALVGMANAPIAVIAVSVIQMRTPPDMRGRVMGMETALTSIAAPLGPLAGGLAIQWLGVSVTLLVVAAGMVAIPLLNVANPTLRDLNLQSATEVVSSGAVAEQVAP